MSVSKFHVKDGPYLPKALSPAMQDALNRRVAASATDRAVDHQKNVLVHAFGSTLGGTAMNVYQIEFAAYVGNTVTQGMVVMSAYDDAQRFFAHAFVTHREWDRSQGGSLSPDALMFLRAFQEWDATKRGSWIEQSIAQSTTVRPRFAFTYLPFLPAFPKM